MKWHRAQEDQSLRGRQWSLFAVLVNLALAALKTIGGVLGHSYALIADGIESTADIISSLIVWGGLKIASAPPDESHPYGHGKAEPLAAVVVAFMLVVAALVIGIQSTRQIVATERVAPAPFTLGVLLVVVITKETLYRRVFKVAQDIKSTAVKSDAWHHRSDAITSVAAFIGISIALIGGPGYESADGWAALVAAGFIAFNGVRLIRPALGEVMDAAPPAEVEASVRQAALAVAGVTQLDKCYVRKMGLEFYVDLHVIVDGSISVQQGHEIAHQVKKAIQTANPKISDVLVHIEPAGAAHEDRLPTRNGQARG